MNKINNILITGGAGYIGSHIVEQLVKTKSNVIIFDNLVTGYKRLINKKAKFINGDIQNRIKLTRGRKVKISGFKKAIITLKKGQSIDLTAGI